MIAILFHLLIMDEIGLDAVVEICNLPKTVLIHVTAQLLTNVVTDFIV